MGLDRRSFLRGSAVVAAGFSLATPFELLRRRQARASEGAGYGPLSPVVDEATGLPLLKLPPGFRYRSFGWMGDPMSDGRPTPPGHDGAAVLTAPDGSLHYLRNHELTIDPRLPLRGSFAPPESTYDAGEAPGGVTGVRFDPATGRAEAARPLLSGTIRNCAGGPTPWGTWLSCEETFDDASHSRQGARLEQSHGWVFEVPITGTRHPEPIRALGRFMHEAVAIDPRTGIAYQTEDQNVSGLYRFLPDKPGQLAAGGRLEMLAVSGRPRLESWEGLEPGAWLPVEWVPIADPERVHVDPEARDALGVAMQGLEQGAAAFRRGEGIFFGNDRIYFVASTGGHAGTGQVFELDPDASRMRLLHESAGEHVLNRPDNLAVSPRGGLVLCEDAKHARPFLRGLDREGSLFDLAENNVMLDRERNDLRGDFRDKEWAGAAFTPDGRWLLASIQWPGISFAITGPWEHGAL